jgi:serine/threonine-protein kinase
VFELLLPVAGAFQAAHDRGFIHRDIKPDNLYVHRSGDEERVIVLDLGIVKRVAAAESLGVGLRPTATGYLLGTPAFMSPEQAAGDPIDTRTDMYSFGVTMYRAITGSLPFPPTGDAFVVLTKHLYEVPPGFATQGLGAGDCPPEVEALVMRTLAKRPDDRYASMRELAAAMRDALGAALARPPQLLPVTHADTDTGADPYTPLRSARLRGFGRLSAAASVIGSLAAWPAIPEEAVRAENRDDPAIGIELSLRHIPDRPPPAILPLAILPPPISPPPISSPAEAAPAAEPKLQQRSIEFWLKRYSPRVGECQREHGDPDARSLAVEFNVSRTGKILAARTIGRDASLLGPCVDGVLRAVQVDRALAGKQLYKFRLPIEDSP